MIKECFHARIRCLCVAPKSLSRRFAADMMCWPAWSSGRVIIKCGMTGGFAFQPEPTLAGFDNCSACTRAGGWELSWPAMNRRIRRPSPNCAISRAVRRMPAAIGSRALSSFSLCDFVLSPPSTFKTMAAFVGGRRCGRCLPESGSGLRSNYHGCAWCGSPSGVRAIRKMSRTTVTIPVILLLYGRPCINPGAGVLARKWRAFDPCLRRWRQGHSRCRSMAETPMRYSMRWIGAEMSGGTRRRAPGSGAAYRRKRGRRAATRSWYGQISFVCLAPTTGCAPPCGTTRMNRA